MENNEKINVPVKENNTVETVGTPEIDVLLASEGKIVKIGDDELKVKPYNWVQTLKLASPFRTVVHAVLDNSEKLSYLSEIKDGSSIQQVYGIIDVFADIDNADELADSLALLVSASIDKDIDYVKSLDIDDMIELSVEVFKVNKDFFAQKLSKIQKLMPATKIKDTPNKKSAPMKSSKN